MNILIVGCGAVGAFYGAALAQAGASVSVVSRSESNWIREHGIQIKSVYGDGVFRPVQAFPTVGEAGGDYDVIIVTTKVLPSVNVPDLIRPALGPQTAIALLQNGVGIEEGVVEAFPHHEIIRILAFICVSRVGQGEVVHQDYGRLVLGSFPAGISEKTVLLSALFVKAGLTCSLREDIQRACWEKLVWNAPFNPLSVLSGGKSTLTLVQAPFLSVVRSVMEEVCLLAEADGWPLGPDIIEKNLTNTMKMTPYKTSMLLDFEHKRPMEVDAILGVAVRLAKEKNLSVPRLEMMWVLLEALNRA